MTEELPTILAEHNNPEIDWDAVRAEVPDLPIDFNTTGARYLVPDEQKNSPEVHANDIGRYILEGGDTPWGGGSQVKVFRGLDLRLGVPVILRAIYPDDIEDLSERQKAITEISTEAAIASAAYGAPTPYSLLHCNKFPGGKDNPDKEAYVSISRLIPDTEGGWPEKGKYSNRLDAIMKKGIEDPEALRILRGLAEVIEHNHAKGIDQRDLKPSNILLYDQRVVLTDYGIASQKGRTNDVWGGTPSYAAPEQFIDSNNGEFGMRSNVYAMGSIAMEMLVRYNVNTRGRTETDIYEIVLNASEGILPQEGKDKLVEKYGPTKGNKVAEVFTRAFKANPEDRFETPGEFVDALQNAL